MQKWMDVPHEKRQVYSAWANVPVEACKKCNYFKLVDGGNIHGQPGACHYNRITAGNFSMTGKALCEE